MNGWDIILLIGIGAAVALAICSIRGRRRSGKGCHGCDGACTKGQSCSRQRVYIIF